MKTLSRVLVSTAALLLTFLEMTTSEKSNHSTVDIAVSPTSLPVASETWILICFPTFYCASKLLSLSPLKKTKKQNISRLHECTGRMPCVVAYI